MHLHRAHLESHRPRWKIDSGDIHDLLVLALDVISQKGQGGENGGRSNVEGELVFVDRELLNVFGKTGEKVLSVLVHRRVDFL